MVDLMSSLVGFVSFLLLSWLNQLSHWECFWLRGHLIGWYVIQAKITRFKMHTAFIHNLLISVWPFDHLLFVRISWALRFASPSCGVIGKLGTLPGSLASSGDEFGCWGQKWKTLEARRVVFVCSWLRGICPVWAKYPGRDLTVADVDDPPDLWSATGFSMCVS